MSVQAADPVPARSGMIVLRFSGWAELLSAKEKSTQLLSSNQLFYLHYKGKKHRYYQERKAVLSLRSLLKTLLQLKAINARQLLLLLNSGFSLVALLAAAREQCFSGNNTGKILLVEWNF